MHSFAKPCFLASEVSIARQSRDRLIALYGDHPEAEADVIIALGGDGFMLRVLNRTQCRGTPVYGMNRGTVGFLMNEYSEQGLETRLAEAEQEVINPLAMTAIDAVGDSHRMLAINEVALLRAGPQAAWLRIIVDGRVRLEELICDGAMVATPAGSTAYNYSAHGPILPIGSDVLALTPVASFRPRRWRGALLPKSAHVRFKILNHEDRPVMADADGTSANNVVQVDVESEPSVSHRLLFDHGHGLNERLIREQFV